MKNLKKYLLKPIITSLMVVSIYQGISFRFGLFDSARFFTNDLFAKIKYCIKPAPGIAKDIVILSIDNTAYDYFGKKWPWEREVFAELVYRLSTLQPKVIGLNLAFAGASKNSAVDDLLAHSFTSAGDVIIASYFDSKGGYHAPYDVLASACKAFGFTNKPNDKDMVIRRTRLFTRAVYDIILDYSFELKAACLFHGIPFEHIDFNGREVVITYNSKKWKIPVNKDGTMPLNYSARLKDFTLVPILDMLQNKVSADSIKGKILILGMTGEAFRDIQKTPFGPLPGAAIIANNILMFLNNSYVKVIPWIIYLILLIGISLLCGVLCYRSSSTKGFVYIAITVLMFILISIILGIFDIQWDYFGIPFVLLIIYSVTNSYKNIGLFIENIFLKRSLIRDPLTGLAAKNYFVAKLQKEMNKGRNISLVIFKLNNYSNLSSKTLKQVSSLIIKNSRKTRRMDFISRYSEDIFCVILYNISGELTKRYAERIKDTISRKANVSIYIGMVLYPSDKRISSADELIQAAMC